MADAVGASFPRQQARTRRFTLGAPRSFSVSPDGKHVLFLRSGGPENAVTGLWAYDVAAGSERQLAGGRDSDELTPEERVRRERVREIAGGIVAYATDRAHKQAVHVLGGDLWHVDVPSGEARLLPARSPVYDPRLDPTGQHVAYCCEGALRVLDLSGDDRELVAPDGEHVTWGMAEFVAAEEMGRSRGFWWAPDGAGLLVARVDESPVGTWWIADPAHPETPARAHRYPAAGTADAAVSLWHVGLDGRRREVRWHREAFPYLVRLSWTDGGPPLLLVESRDHHRSQVLRAEPSTWAVSVERDDRDGAWLETAPGVPAWLADGRLVWAAADPECDTYRLVVGDEAVTPPGIQVRAVLDVGEAVVFSASREPTTIDVWRWSPDEGLSLLSPPGSVSTAAASGPTTVLVTRDLARPQARVTVNGRGEIPNLSATPAVQPAVRWVDADELALGVVLPSNARPGQRFPVVMAPYGGPGHQAAMAAQHLWWEPQWLADQGFGVVVADGRGTPGRGPAWERRIHRDFAAVLDDQVTALEAATASVPELDGGRVGIRGWSFGGYLAALAVLRRPDLFHAAVAGAPVTDWTLYDTYYTEKYLGWPVDPSVYAASSLLDARDLRRPLMIIHGLVDDNVVVAHSLRLSQALLEAGRPHTVLPLSGVTHMTPQEEVAENLLLLQVEFLKEHLA